MPDVYKRQPTIYIKSASYICLPPLLRKIPICIIVVAWRMRFPFSLHCRWSYVSQMTS